MITGRRTAWFTTFVACTLLVLLASPALAHPGDEEPGSSYIVEGDLVPEEAVPGPGPDFAGAFPTLTIDPHEGSLCYDMFWDEFDDVTHMVIRLGYPDTSGTFEIDVDAPPEDEFGDDGLFAAHASGCVDGEPDLLDFIAHEPSNSHLTVYSIDYPDGAVGGFLFLRGGPETEPDGDDGDEGLMREDELTESIEDLLEHEESGRGLVDYIPHLIAFLALAAVTIFAVYAFRRARGL